MVGGGIQQAPAVQRIQNLGLGVIVTDKNKNAPAFQGADLSLTVDATDVKTLISWVLYHKDKYAISGIFTLTSLAPYVSIVANACGLPSLPVDIVFKSDNKLLMKKIFHENGIKTPDYIATNNADEIKEFMNSSGTNIYLKAPDLFGGKGVVKIEKNSEIDSTLKNLGHLTSSKLFLAEKELCGKFIDAQGFFVDDMFYPAGIADSYFTNDNEEFKNFNPVEYLNIAPSQQSETIKEKVYRLLEDSCRCLKINWGPVGGDFILANDGQLYVIEVGPRLHGPNATLQIFPAASGTEPFEFMIQLLTSSSNLNFDLLQPKRSKVSICHVFVSHNTDINKVAFDNKIDKCPGVFCKYIYWNPKHQKNINKAGLSGLAALYLVERDYDNAIELLNKVKGFLKIDYAN